MKNIFKFTLVVLMILLLNACIPLTIRYYHFYAKGDYDYKKYLGVSTSGDINDRYVIGLNFGVLSKEEGIFSFVNHAEIIYKDKKYIFTNDDLVYNYSIYDHSVKKNVKEKSKRTLFLQDKGLFIDMKNMEPDEFTLILGKIKIGNKILEVPPIIMKKFVKIERGYPSGNILNLPGEGTVYSGFVEDYGKKK